MFFCATNGRNTALVWHILEFTNVRKKKHLLNLSDLFNHCDKTVRVWFFVFLNYLYLHSYPGQK